MSRPKGAKNKKTKEVVEKKEEIKSEEIKLNEKDVNLNNNEETQQVIIPNKTELVVKLLQDKIPSLFDRFPQGSLSRSGVEKLVEEITILLK